jgi:hypothetical protein
MATRQPYVVGGEPRTASSRRLESRSGSGDPSTAVFGSAFRVNPCAMSERNPSADTRMAAEFLLIRMGQDEKAAAEFIDTVLDNPNGPGAVAIVAGLLDVGAALVQMLVEARGAVTDDDKRTMAREILRSLPENPAQ